MAILPPASSSGIGVGTAPHGRRTWSAFSDALRDFPFDINVLYNGPQQMGPANLLYGEPTGYQATMVGLPYDEIALALELFTITQKDSRIGFEASNHYFYLPLDLVEKAINCESLRRLFDTRQ